MNRQEKVADVCSRIYFGSTPVLQPAYSGNGASVVCAGCAVTCGSYQQMTPLVQQSEFVCGCGTHCLYAARFGTEACNAAARQQAAEDLNKEVIRIIDNETDTMGKRAVRVFSADVLRGLATTRAHMNFVAALDPNGPRATVRNIAWHVAMTIGISQFPSAVVYSPERVFRSGSRKERCVVFMALLNAVGIQTRMVFSVHGRDAELQCWPEVWLTPDAQWEHVALEGTPSISSDRPAAGQHVLVAIEPSGYITDVTPEDSGAPYRREVLASALLEHNILIVERNPSIRQRVAPELEAGLLVQATRLAESHRALAGSVAMVCVDFMNANREILAKTVDNDSVVPLREVLNSEQRAVEELHHDAFCGSAGEMRAHLRGAALLYRTIQHWPRDQVHLPVRLMGYILASMASVDSQLALEVLLSEPDGGMCSLLTLLASLVSPQATCRPSSQLLIAVAGLLTSFMAQAVDQAAVLGGLPQLLRVLGLLVAASDSRGRQPYQDSVLDKDEVLFGVFQGVQAAMETFLAASTAEDVNDSEQAAVEALCRLLASLVQRAKTRCALFTAVAQAVAAVGNGLFSKWDHVVKQELSAAVRDAGRIPLPDFCNALESDVFK